MQEPMGPEVETDELQRLSADFDYRKGTQDPLIQQTRRVLQLAGVSAAVGYLGGVAFWLLLFGRVDVALRSGILWLVLGALAGTIQGFCRGVWIVVGCVASMIGGGIAAVISVNAEAASIGMDINGIWVVLRGMLTIPAGALLGIVAGSLATWKSRE